jgi:hypothetical protein
VREPLERGVRFHHVTDQVFHALPAFRALNRAACVELDARGVRRGSARAVAHVGVELLLDAELAENESAEALYLDALEAGSSPAPLSGTVFTLDERERLGRLLATLRERGVAKRPSAASLVARLERALARRPRLALHAEDVPKVSEWVELFRARVVASAPLLVGELTSDIERRLAA